MGHQPAPETAAKIAPALEKAEGHVCQTDTSAALTVRLAADCSDSVGLPDVTLSLIVHRGKSKINVRARPALSRTVRALGMGRNIMML